ncbi:acyltransferase family protein [Isoptericola sp. NEAU-Y5]|uniref:Acyltransferase family protein n=1 Tax=Isoptericola luteus TaxID=2879484 RepID=A0ABS7ZIT8_9MICO|nr:acyltransferase [Isoptericola sp. NEAU-Y5]MCA5894941.1 acyltransferase family protein [Isoptericola sp. NEAU-Y5]
MTETTTAPVTAPAPDAGDSPASDPGSAPAGAMARSAGPKSTGPKAAGRPRLAALDALRFVAALGVLVYHYVAVNHQAWGAETAESFPDAQPVAAFGSFGVQLFFVISGFVILMSAWGRGVRSFTASRVGRLFPAYWLSIVAVLLLLLVVAPGTKDVGLSETAANVTMAQRAFGMQDLEPVYWTLWTELRFYVLIGVLLAVGMTRNRLIAFATLWPLAAVVAARSDHELAATVLVGTDAPLFAGGMMLFLLVRERRAVAPWLVLAGNVVLACAVSGRSQSLRIATSTGVTVDPQAYWPAIAACFALVALIALTPVNRLSWRWLTVAGALTYPLYLLHSSWGEWLIERLYPHLPMVVTFAVVTLTMLGAAYLVHRFVERPLGPRLRRAVERDLDRIVRALTPRRDGVTSDQSAEVEPAASR